MSSYTYTAEPETIRYYSESEIRGYIKRKIEKAIRYYKKRFFKWLRETLLMSLGLFCIVVLPVIGMFVHWVMIGY